MKKLFGLLLTRYTIWALAFLVLVILPIAALYFRVDLRDRLWAYLGFGYIPVGLWIAAFLSSLVFGRQLLKTYANLWVGSAFAVVGSLGILSLFFPFNGALDEIGLSGSWGTILGGYPLYYGIPKIAGALWLATVFLAPRLMLTKYWVGSIAVLGFVAMALVFMAVFLKYRFVWMLSMLKSAKTGSDAPATKPARQMSEMISAEEMRLKSNGWEETIGAGFGGIEKAPEVRASTWRLPSLDLLAEGVVESVSEKTLTDMATCIESTMSDHGVEVSVTDIKTGPRVIRFGLLPGRIKRNRDAKSQNDKSPVDMGRVKVHSIVARETDLALALKTSDLRIESTVPGEGFVGLEVPNPNPSLVSMRSVVSNPAFQQIAKKGGLPLALGHGTGGEPIIADLLSLPHLLVAGSTGSGKSVCINSVVMSLLLSNPPDRLRMLMVDPKRVELTPFNGIPHLFAPVIVDPDKVMDVLSGLLREMFARYKLMEEIGVRNIAGYNRKSKEKMPFALLIIDELADLMMTSGFEVEQSLVRLAQLGRATGIHSILCTQRPSVKVVTGLLKANIPGRIAFAVASQVDSRVILDGGGAEKLLGKGDMLYLSSQSPAPRRIQGTYVADSEFDDVIDFWKNQKGPPLPTISIEEPGEDDEALDDLDEDEMLERAREMCEKYQHISPAMLQRRLQIGYPRAMQILELLEEEGVISGGDPGKSRQVLKDRAGSLPY